MGGLLLERQALQAASDKGRGRRFPRHGRRRARACPRGDVGGERHHRVSLGQGTDDGGGGGRRAAAVAPGRLEPRRIVLVSPLPAGRQGAPAPDPLPGDRSAGRARARDRQAHALHAAGQQPTLRLLRPCRPGNAERDAARGAVRSVAPDYHGGGGAGGGWRRGRTGRRRAAGNVPGRCVRVRVRTGGAARARDGRSSRRRAGAAGRAPGLRGAAAVARWPPYRGRGRRAGPGERGRVDVRHRAAQPHPAHLRSGRPPTYLDAGRASHHLLARPDRRRRPVLDSRRWHRPGRVAAGGAGRPVGR